MPLHPTTQGGYLIYGSDGYPVLGSVSSSGLEDFEHQSLAAYGDDLGAFQIQGSNVLQGRYSLESTVAQRTIGASETDRPTPRGTAEDPIEYKCRMVIQDDGQASLITNVQSADSPWSNSYVLLVDTANDRIRLLRRENGSTVNHETAYAPESITDGEEHRPAITLSDDGIKGTLYYADDSVFVETDTYQDATFTGGGLGWHNGIGTTTYFDYATAEPGSIGTVSQSMIEDFESGDLSGYWVRSTSGTASVSPTAAYRGSYGLDMNGFSEVQTTPGGGRPGYLRDGVPAIFRVQFKVTGNQQYWVPFCQTSRDSRSSRYLLQFTMGGGFRIRKVDSSGNVSTVRGSSSEGRDYAALYNVSHSADVWYSAILEVDQNDGLYAELHDGGMNRKGWISSPESEFVGTENGYGFYCSGGGHAFFDHLLETER